MNQETEHNGVVAVEAAETKQKSFHILPCPVCGADEASTYLGDPGPGVVRCFAVGCDAVVSGYATDCEAIEEWNRRSAAMTNGRCASDELTECFRHHIAEAIGWQAFGFRPGREMQMYEEGFKAGYRRCQSDNEAELGEADAVDIPGSIQPMTDHKDARQLLADITAGLEGVTPGPWEEHAGLIRAIDGDEAIPICDMRTPWKKHSRTKTVVRQECHNSRHIARCDPDTMRTIDREFTALTLELAAAKQRIAELEAERQWQPIETAPKDGTVILGKGGIYHGVPFPVKWAPSQYSPDRSWEDVINRTNFDDHCITHWMPLPASPRLST